MKKAVLAKIKSTGGASLSIALLLFLVCAVIGGAVLAAGTVSAGRFSELAEMDQRYYSVASAAELLAHELSGKTVTIVRSKTLEKTVTATYTFTESTSGSTSVTSTSTTAYNATYHTDINGSQPADVTATTSDGTIPTSAAGVPVTADSFLTAQAVALMFGSNPCNTDAAMGYSFSGGSAQAETAFTMTHSGSGIDADALGITGAYQLKADGTIVIRLHNTTGADQYTLVVTLQPEITETGKTETTGGDAPVITNTDTGYEEVLTSTTTYTKTASITWTVGGIQKEVA
ncbi:MAG: hypothetical protein K6C36_02840 [Clostridia bacterium]|nr:hypothetical protein [Clostridia bacterium]